MKRIVMFTAMALLLGGFAFNANAQDKYKTTSKGKVQNNSTKPETKGETNTSNTSSPSEEDIRFWNDLLDRYESAINEYQNSESAESKVKSVWDEIDRNTVGSMNAKRGRPKTTEQSRRYSELKRRHDQYKNDYQKKHAVWDKELNDYEAAINNYKNKGLIQEAEEIQYNIESSKDQLTSTQLSRFQSLNRQFEQIKTERRRASNVINASDIYNSTQQTTTSGNTKGTKTTSSAKKTTKGTGKPANVTKTKTTKKK